MKWISMIGLIVAGVMFAWPGQVYAQPNVQIIAVEPDVRNQTILLDGRLTEIKCVAKSDRPDVRLQWTLDGPGRFDGATTGIASFYLPPEKIVGTSAQVEITMTATDAQGNTARDTLTFTLQAPPEPTPRPAPTRTPTPRPAPAPTQKPTRTPSPRPTATPTLTPQPTRTPTPRPTVTPTLTPQPTRTPTPRPTVTPTLTPQPTPTRTPPPEPTVTPQPTPTRTLTPRPTPSPTPTQTPATEEASTAVQLPNNGGDLVFLRVPGGQYDMGCGAWADQCGNDEEVHTETVATFWIGQHEITRKQWAALMGNVNTITPDVARLPVENVSWNETQEFIHKIAPLFPQHEIRLPTEAEWEYACRSGGQPQNYAGGDDPEPVAWYANNSGRKAHPVGQKQPNGLGIYDMSGNVREWTQDDYREILSGVGGAAAPPKGTKTVRGGGWLNAAKYLRCSNREQYFADSRKSGLGFRLVLKKR